MRFIDASEANTNFSKVLKAVEQGETFVIMRDGRPIARFSGEAPTEPGSDQVDGVKSMEAGR
jgi:antitoxin (DNA-binding transcriptional repressor) of toxin-antitoxin stability system